MRLKTTSGQKINIDDQPLASGGEGAVHKIDGSKSDCVKLYLPGCATAQREAKLKFMTQNPPPPASGGRFLTCWPKELVYESGRFVGFTMPLAFRDSLPLYELTRYTLNDDLPSVWKKYRRDKKEGDLSRLKMSLNLAAAIHSIHSLNNYTLVDFKPHNVLVTHDGSISLIDCDSVQITQNGVVRFNAQVTTADYAPKECLGLELSKSRISQSWDRFALAVVFYELLTGIHPYTGSFNGRFEKVESIADAIQNDLFAWGGGRNYLKVTPKPHNKFTQLPSGLQSLFVKALNSNASGRPAAADWGQAFYTAIAGPAAAPQTKSQPKPTVTVKPQPEVSAQNVSPTESSFGPLKWAALLAVLILGLWLANAMMPEQADSGLQNAKQARTSYHDQQDEGRERTGQRHER